MKIEIAKEEDRLTVAAIIVKNGYTVRQIRERKGTTIKTYTHYIEANKNEVTNHVG